MKFSIVIPCYNGEKFIERALLSALYQTRAADEIIISDDKSSDNTIDICKKYINKVFIHINENGPSGFVDAWNNAINYASGDFISILHQDDILNPKFLEEAEIALSSNPDVKHFFVPCNYIDTNDTIIREPEYCTGETIRYTGKEYINAYQNIGVPHIHRCPGVLTHRDIFKVCKYRKEAGHIADDDFFYRVGQYTDILGVLKPLASYREHNLSETGHLQDYMLVERLLHDYCYQLKHCGENKLFTKKNIDYFVKLKHKYAKRLIGYSIKDKNFSLIKNNLKYILL